MNASLTATDFFVLRTPTLPAETMREWSDGIEAEDALSRGADIDAAVERDARTLRRRLRQIVGRADVRAAIGVASPSLDARLGCWLDGQESEASRDVEPVVVRYVTRMAGRATPFGLFAGCSTGTAGARTHLIVPPRWDCTRVTQLNLDWLFAYAIRLAATAPFRDQLRFRSNSSVYRVGNKLRYYATQIEPGAKRNARAHRLREVVWSEHLDVALEAARGPSGATLDDIAARVAAHFGVNAVEARTYVEGLVRTQLFWSTLLPGCTGKDPLCMLVDGLRTIDGATAIVSVLARMHATLALLDAEGRESAVHFSSQLIDDAKALAPDLDVTNLLCVDLMKPHASVSLSKPVMRRIADGVELLAAMMPDSEPALASFIQNFEERYQGREIPLLEALDPETGIGFDQRTGVDITPLIKQLSLRSLASTTAPWRMREQFLLAKVADALRARSNSIELSKSDVASLREAHRVKLPVGQTAIVTLAAKSADAVDGGDYRIFISGGGHVTSAALFARFLNSDPVLDAHVRAALRQEEESDRGAVHAEIAHHIEGYFNNAPCRPVLRDYEIDVLGGSGAHKARQIALDDLLVSVRDGQVTLRSKALGRRVIPHLSNAHGYGSPGNSVYRFLANVQLQGVRSGIAWSWGNALSGAPFLPRVTHENFVLSLATWRIPSATMAAIAKLTGAARFRAVQALRTTKGMPRHVCLVEEDNVLPVDLSNVLSIDSMLSASKRVPIVELREQFPAPDELVARGAEGSFYHELLIPLLRTSDRAPSTTVLSAVREIAPTPYRSKWPGEDWLCAKLYCGTVGCDELLLNVVGPLLESLRANGLVDRWFFIRYADPRYHMRLRVHGEAKRLWTEVAPQLFAALSTARDLVHHFVVDGYDREVERYGGEEAMDLAEEVFEADSDLLLKCLPRLRGRQLERWKMTLLGMHEMLVALDVPLEKRRAIVTGARDRWASHLNAGAETNRSLGSKYREHRMGVEALLAAPVSCSWYVDSFRMRDATLRGVGLRLRNLERRGTLTAEFEDVVRSYLHMWANRALRGSANAHELVLYDFLARAYDGALARARSVGSSQCQAAVARA